ncbi:EF_hand_5 domain-containing protein/EF_hand_6 domain-containing protein [Cephalotus follicularis]|uniref:EF_hand_5 domain-containing protein/EF_hand_6 domain-containing protein n=1 Tax=Cephalotus follicularis TaxID=3775 RepID=A0A1Q3CCA5_CEPFO|nr:EF_hand_5 domain-containing protein/EF_hand_6 domain-containing protein [Cephalotus follicularis]
MATDRVVKPSRSGCFSNTGVRLSIHRRRSKSSSTLSSPKSPMSPCTSKNGTRENQLKEVFRHFDGDGDGKISAIELRAFFGSIGEYMSYEEAQGVIDDLDTDGDDLLDFDDFLKLMTRDGSEEDLKRAFEMFELEKGSGCITPKSLQKMLHRLGDNKSLDECAAMIQVFDTDGNGVVDFHEFHQMMIA